MVELVTVRLHGALADKYGAEHHFAISSPAEAIAALNANYPGFRRDFLAMPFYGLIVDGDNRHPGNCENVELSPIARDIHFVPMVEAHIVAGIASLITTYIGIAGTAATLLATAIAVGLLVGISLLLAPKVETPKEERDTNYLFSGPQNTTEQGVAVPVVYGRVFVGSVVVSAGIEIANAFKEDNQRTYNWLTPENPNPTVIDLGSVPEFAEPEDVAARVAEPAPEPERGRPAIGYVPESA